MADLLAQPRVRSAGNASRSRQARPTVARRVADAGHVAREDVGPIGAWDWGPMLAARAMWSELGLDTILDNLARPDRRAVVRLADRALVLVANRLTTPGSEHALAQWLENDFVCDRSGPALRRGLARGSGTQG